MPASLGTRELGLWAVPLCCAIIPITIYSLGTTPGPTGTGGQELSQVFLLPLGSPSLVQPASHIPSSTGKSELPPLPPSYLGTPHLPPSLCPRVILDLNSCYVMSIHSGYLKGREEATGPAFIEVSL